MSNPTTFLNLCKRTRQECGIAGTGPATVDGQTGELLRVVDWVQSAYSDIQNLHTDWDFLWGEATLNLTQDVASYTAPFTENNVREFDGPLFVFDSTIGATDKSRLTFIPYRSFRDRFLGTTQSSGRPSYFTLKPNETAIVFDRRPDHGNYTLDYTYWRDTHTLTANVDTVLIPAKHTLIIVWRAVMLYAQYEEVTNLYKLADEQYNRCLRDLRESHLPKRVIQMRPLA